MHPNSGKPSRRVVEYDLIRRRVWIRGQRCHHGATGLVVAGLACIGLFSENLPAGKPPLDSRTMLATVLTDSRTMLAGVLTGGAMMAHDWKDRSIWFERGRGSQP